MTTFSTTIIAVLQYITQSVKSVHKHTKIPITPVKFHLGVLKLIKDFNLKHVLL